MTLPRRAIIKLSLAVSGIISLWGILRFLSFQEPDSVITQVTLESPESYPLGSVTPVPQARAWIIRDDLGLYAISSVCTHLGCLVSYDGIQFECPCHGSKFDLNGDVLNGPAQSPLVHVELTVSPDNLLVLNTKNAVSTIDRVPIDFSQGNNSASTPSEIDARV